MKCNFQYFAGKRSLVVFQADWIYTHCIDDDFKSKGLDEVYCLSVNDSFVMNAWAEKHEIENVKMIPDGSGEFTRDMNMLVWKPAQNFGYRSWRYAMVVNDMEVEKLWREDGINQMGLDDDPYDITKPENLLNSL